MFAYELVNRILEKNNHKKLSRRYFQNIVNEDIKIDRHGQTFNISIKKKKKQRSNSSLVYKYKFSELDNAIKANVFRNIDFYDIEIDVRLLLD